MSISQPKLPKWIFSFYLIFQPCDIKYTPFTIVALNVGIGAGFSISVELLSYGLYNGLNDILRKVMLFFHAFSYQCTATRAISPLVQVLNIVVCVTEVTRQICKHGFHTGHTQRPPG